MGILYTLKETCWVGLYIIIAKWWQYVWSWVFWFVIILASLHTLLIWHSDEQYVYIHYEFHPLQQAHSFQVTEMQILRTQPWGQDVPS